MRSTFSSNLHFKMEMRVVCAIFRPGITCVKLLKPVTLAQIKAEESLKDISLVRQGRLSVMPLKATEFDKILEMGS